LIDDKIVLSQIRRFNIDVLKCPNFIGNQIHGFRRLVQNDAGDRFIQYCKIDLNKLTEETINVPLVLNDDRVIYKFGVDILLLFLI
jgi:hypothetical protein